MAGMRTQLRCVQQRMVGQTEVERTSERASKSRGRKRDGEGERDKYRATETAFLYSASETHLVKEGVAEHEHGGQLEGALTHDQRHEPHGVLLDLWEVSACVHAR